MRFTTTPASRVLGSAVSCLIVVGALAACSSSSSASSSASGSSSAPASSAASSTGSAEPSADPSAATATASPVALPDPCTLLTVEHIKGVIKVDPGTSVSSEKECRFSSGLLLGITGAADWNAAANAIAADTKSDSKGPIQGLGEEALTATYGTTRLVIARQGDFVAAAQGAIDQQQGIDLVGGMLQSLAALSSK